MARSHYKFGLAERTLIRSTGKTRKLYKYKHNYTLKNLRKTFATYYSEEHGVEATQERMRHTSLKTTQDHYVILKIKESEIDTCILQGDQDLVLHQLLFKGANMRSSYDPSQETLEEYLRRIHLKDKLDMEWKNDQKEINPARDVHPRCRGWLWRFTENS